MKMFLLILVLFFSGMLAHSASPDNWHKEGAVSFEFRKPVRIPRPMDRVDITVNAAKRVCKEPLKDYPVIVSAAEITDFITTSKADGQISFKKNKLKITPKSIRVVRAGKVLPSQVDDINLNGLLDGEDEISFYVDFGKDTKATSVYIYFNSGDNSLPAETGKSSSDFSFKNDHIAVDLSSTIQAKIYKVKENKRILEGEMSFYPGLIDKPEGTMVDINEKPVNDNRTLLTTAEIKVLSDGAIRQIVQARAVQKSPSPMKIEFIYEFYKKCSFFKVRKKITNIGPDAFSRFEFKDRLQVSPGGCFNRNKDFFCYINHRPRRFGDSTKWPSGIWFSPYWLWAYCPRSDGVGMALEEKSIEKAVSSLKIGSGTSKKIGAIAWSPLKNMGVISFVFIKIKIPSGESLNYNVYYLVGNASKSFKNNEMFHFYNRYISNSTVFECTETQKKNVKDPGYSVTGKTVEKSKTLPIHKGWWDNNILDSKIWPARTAIKIINNTGKILLPPVCIPRSVLSAKIPDAVSWALVDPEEKAHSFRELNGSLLNFVLTAQNGNREWDQIMLDTEIPPGEKIFHIYSSPEKIPLEIPDMLKTRESNDSFSISSGHFEIEFNKSKPEINYIRIRNGKDVNYRWDGVARNGWTGNVLRVAAKDMRVGNSEKNKTLKDFTVSGSSFLKLVWPGSDASAELYPSGRIFLRSFPERLTVSTLDYDSFYNPDSGEYIEETLSDDVPVPQGKLTVLANRCAKSFLSGNFNVENKLVETPLSPSFERRGKTGNSFFISLPGKDVSEYSFAGKEPEMVHLQTDKVKDFPHEKFMLLAKGKEREFLAGERKTFPFKVYLSEGKDSIEVFFNGKKTEYEKCLRLDENIFEYHVKIPTDKAGDFALKIKSEFAKEEEIPLRILPGFSVVSIKNKITGTFIYPFKKKGMSGRKFETIPNPLPLACQLIINTTSENTINMAVDAVEGLEGMSFDGLRSNGFKLSRKFPKGKSKFILWFHFKKASYGNKKLSLNIYSDKFPENPIHFVCEANIRIQPIFGMRGTNTFFLNPERKRQDYELYSEDLARHNINTASRGFEFLKHYAAEGNRSLDEPKLDVASFKEGLRQLYSYDIRSVIGAGAPAIFKERKDGFGRKTPNGPPLVSNEKWKKFVRSCYQKVMPPLDKEPYVLAWDLQDEELACRLCRKDFKKSIIGVPDPDNDYTLEEISESLSFIYDTAVDIGVKKPLGGVDNSCSYTYGLKYWKTDIWCYDFYVPKDGLAEWLDKYISWCSQNIKERNSWVVLSAHGGSSSPTILAPVSFEVRQQALKCYGGGIDGIFYYVYLTPFRDYWVVKNGPLGPVTTPRWESIGQAGADLSLMAEIKYKCDNLSGIPEDVKQNSLKLLAAGVKEANTMNFYKARKCFEAALKLLESY